MTDPIAKQILERTLRQFEQGEDPREILRTALLDMAARCDVLYTKVCEVRAVN